MLYTNTNSQCLFGGGTVYQDSSGYDAINQCLSYQGCVSYLHVVPLLTLNTHMRPIQAGYAWKSGQLHFWNCYDMVKSYSLKSHGGRHRWKNSSYRHPYCPARLPWAATREGGWRGPGDWAVDCVSATHHFGLDFTQDGRSDLVSLDQSASMPSPRV